MTPRDVFEILAAADPARDHPGLDPASPRGQALLERAVETRPVVIDIRRRRAVIAIAVGLAVLGAAAAAWIATRRPTHTLSVGCYAEARLDANTYVISAREGDALESCLELWRTGTFGAPSSPPLVRCVLSSGAVGVFPGGAGTCERLGRPRAEPVPSSSPTTLASDRVAELRDRLDNAFRMSAPCLEPHNAMVVVQVDLKGAGLEGWSVVTQPPGFTAERPCVSWSIDEGAKTVYMVPFPRR